MKKVCVVLGGIAALAIFVALVTMWVADATPIYNVEEENGVLYVTLLHQEAITDVAITPSEERVHLDIYYGGSRRHVHVETNGKPILISPVRLKVTSISKEFFTDQLNTRWHWKGGTLLPHHGQRLYGAIGYSPATNICAFLEQENDDGPLRALWERER